MTDEKMIDEMMVDEEMMMVSRCQSDKPPAPPFRPEPLPLALGELHCDPRYVPAAQDPYQPIFHQCPWHFNEEKILSLKCI